MSDHFPIVALVCSAGGLDALRRVLTPLPADLPAAIIVLQHHDPRHVSDLAALLQSRTALSVVPAADGDVLLPGRVLVAPAGQHTLVTPEQTIALIPSGPLPPYRPSADLLLTTLATAAGPRVVAVVLSGRGNDAATGASAVHRFGGTVIASSVATSTQSAMPEATIRREAAIDYIVPLDETAALLVTIAAAPQFG
jgi:two-component system, chemotaxis family, protein-glutamate methylesterase/glutaminase